MKTALAIAGSDSSGGAGIQADIKTMMAHGVYAETAVTSLTAQNTTGVTAIQDASPDFLGQELEAVFSDIRPDAVKTGMVSDPELIHVIAEKLKIYKPCNVVMDPVMVSTSGVALLKDSAREVLVTELLPLADLITPNIPEAEKLSGIKIMTSWDMVNAAGKIHDLVHTSVLLKGGHSVSDSSDLLITDRGRVWFRGVRIDNPNTHGTGCTLSSSIASNLALGYSLEDSVARAKAYISLCLDAMLDLGHGSGPLNHCCARSPELFEEKVKSRMPEIVNI